MLSPSEQYWRRLRSRKPPVMPELPNGPAKPGFDISRFALTPFGTFETFYVKRKPSRSRMSWTRAESPPTHDCW
jgi:hypothetical protein